VSPELLRTIAAALEAEADRVEERVAARAAEKHAYERKPIGKAAREKLTQRRHDDFTTASPVDVCTKCGTKRIARPWRYYVDGTWQDTKPACSR
jgi:hypothetical protein